MRKVICFHAPEEGYGFLSNWYPSEFKIDGKKFSSMEQYMMYNKAVTFGDSEIARQILDTDNAGKIKALGRAISNYDDTVWNGVRQIIIYRGLLEKFRQNDKLRDMLLATGDNILAECAVQDRIWGIGLSMKDERRFDIRQWTGQNLLGFALMCVRAELRNNNV
ncbi:MAG: NADAR family protein [Oscillospiraceae bacterium]